MKQYLDLLARVRREGVRRPDRTGTGTLGIFGHQLRFELGEEFPLVTTKRVHFRSVVRELLWLLSGSTNVADLRRHGVTIWDERGDENGELGPVCGRQWRSWLFLDSQPFRVGCIVCELLINKRLLGSMARPSRPKQFGRETGETKGFEHE